LPDETFFFAFPAFFLSFFLFFERGGYDVYLTLYNFEEANLLLFTTFRKNLRFGEAERAHIQ